MASPAVVRCDDDIGLTHPLRPTPLTFTGIKMPKRQRYMSRKGVDPKFLRNQKYCVKGIRAKIVAEGGKKA